MKTVWITGASGGIGNAAARLFAQEGYQVAAGYCRGEERAQALCGELRREGFAAQAFGADLTQSAAVEETLRAIEARFGGVDVLVNNAGIAQQTLLTDVTDAQWRRMFAVNVDSAFYCCRAVIPHMVRQKSGRIINVSSVWGVRGASCEAPYSASKAALIGLTKALAKELGPSGICVNCVAPGVIDTPMNACFDDGTMRQLADETPLCRIGTPEEAARAILFFASPAADFVTGQVLCADGGFMV
ncbi:MAG: 3-oxoacyl-ACP reductase FabG [Clostridia bacterium]|nr:3-oxoacyl-ACP reductase FabG [Clostridia bacterium]